MPRIVPSQVVEVIKQSFPKLETVKKFTLGYSNANSLVAIIALIEQIPSELIVLSDKKYTEFVTAVAAIKYKIEQWNFNERRGLVNILGVSDENPIALIYQALSECPDEFPSADTSELDFI